MTSHLRVEIARINHLDIPRDPPRRETRIRPNRLGRHRSNGRDDAVMRVRSPALDAGAVEERRPVAVFVGVDIATSDRFGLDMVHIG